MTNEPEFIQHSKEGNKNLIVWYPDEKRFDIEIDSTLCGFDPPSTTWIAGLELDDHLAEKWKLFIPICRKILDMVNDESF